MNLLYCVGTAWLAMFLLTMLFAHHAIIDVSKSVDPKKWHLFVLLSMITILAMAPYYFFVETVPNLANLVRYRFWKWRHRRKTYRKAKRQIDKFYDENF